MRNFSVKTRGKDISLETEYEGVNWIKVARDEVQRRALRVS
jgi:hypothetical protein